jgi:hypothetical protein
MKSYIVNLDGKTGIRSIDELNTMLEYMIQEENYELCSVIKKVIDNYDELVKLNINRYETFEKF